MSTHDRRPYAARPPQPSALPPLPHVQPVSHDDPHAWQVPVPPGRTVILMPGQMAFCSTPSTLRTLLGSCVSITLWHPIRRLGGMCHFLLPQRPRKTGVAPDGRYGDEAVEQMVHHLRRAGTRPEDYVAHLYGGADTMPEVNTSRFNVGERNIEQGWRLIDHYGFQLDGVDVGENIPRTVTLDMGSGQVSMQRGAGQAPINNAFVPLGTKAYPGAER